MQGEDLHELDFLVGESWPMRKLKEMLRQVARVDFSLLVTGESGTGKELVARAVHGLSRRPGSFVVVNCAAIPESLLEAEMFGFRRGAFTGAAVDRTGLAEAAHRGTLFLDEVADLPLPLQGKLLRLLQGGEVRRLGENRSTRADFRVISATNRNIREMVEGGTFREDLYYRLQDLTIAVPPLRERPGDIPLLVAHFLAKHGRCGGQPALALGLAECLKRRGFPGNVRELESEVKRAITFGFEFAAQIDPVQMDVSLRGAREGAERLRVLQALRESGGRRAVAAERLGVTRQTLFNLLRKHRLSGLDAGEKKETAG